ncbi:hypothetical protein [Micromonospora sp. B9E7]|uniref:hypothetical protein n=1 Tax=Micromonospora sp. B9E7 TaxID=3153574 RepID=UPI00325EA2F4
MTQDGSTSGSTRTATHASAGGSTAWSRRASASPVPGVRFADLNGDRRADYLVEDPGGQIRAWTFNGYYVIQKAPDTPMSGTPTTPDVDIDLDPCVLVLNINRGPCDT